VYASEIFRESFFSLSIPTHKFQKLMAQLRVVWTWAGSNSGRADALHGVLRLDVVSVAGQPPTSYGWQVDGLLNVRMQPAGEPLRAAVEPPPAGDDPRPPDRGVRARIYRVPRTRGRPRLRPLVGGLSGDAA